MLRPDERESEEVGLVTMGSDRRDEDLTTKKEILRQRGREFDEILEKELFGQKPRELNEREWAFLASVAHEEFGPFRRALGNGSALWPPRSPRRSSEIV